MAKKYIDVDKFLSQIEYQYMEHDITRAEYMNLEDRLLQQPAADVVEVKHGKWIPVTNGRGGHECDQCHEYAPSWATGEEHLTNFCPNCGAKMRGDNDE